MYSRDTFPEIHYIHKIEIDFEELPHYIIKKGIIWRFEKVTFHNDTDYSEWQTSWANLLQTLPETHIIKTIQKGLEYGKKVYQYHLSNECSNKLSCPYNESWERRIAIAEHFFNSVIKAVEPEETVLEDEKSNSKEFTTGRQVLAIHYLLEYCQVKNIDNTAKARFIQFLTGKETGAKTISNTTIYKKAISPLSTNNKTLNTDLQFIRKYFEDLGLAEIAKMITNEIGKSE